LVKRLRFNLRRNRTPSVNETECTVDEDREGSVGPQESVSVESPERDVASVSSHVFVAHVVVVDIRNDEVVVLAIKLGEINLTRKRPLSVFEVVDGPQPKGLLNTRD